MSSYQITIKPGQGGGWTYVVVDLASGQAYQGSLWGDVDTAKAQAEAFAQRLLQAPLTYTFTPEAPSE